MRADGGRSKPHSIRANEFAPRASWGQAVVTTLLLLTIASPAPVVAATLRGGDVVVLGCRSFYNSGHDELFVVTPADGTVQHLWITPPVTSARDLVVLRDGTLLVCDLVEGVLRVDPGDGTWQVVAGLGAFGGSAPSAMTLAPNGDVLAAGAFGVMRLAGGTGAPLSVSSGPFPGEATGIATDGGANVWVCHYQIPNAIAGIVNVNATSGARTDLVLSCSTALFPVYGLASLHYRNDGSLYVMNAPDSYAPSAVAYGGIYRVEPATGVATPWLIQPLIVSFDWDASDQLWKSVAHTISRTPTYGLVEGGPWQISLGNRGAVTIVPAGVTATRSSTWGALKRLYR